MTRTIYARGHLWSGDTLYDGWGDNVDNDQVTALGNLVVERFHELCEKHGDPSIYWTPQTSEVTYEVKHSTWKPVYKLDTNIEDLAEQALEEVWNAVLGYDTPVSDKVDEIFEESK